MSVSEIRHRSLTHDEIGRLVSQGCWAEDWGKVMVAEEGFDVHSVVGATFRGHVQLGKMMRDSFLFRSTLENVTLGRGFRISDVGLLSGYVIGDGFTATACSVIRAGTSSFGIGTPIRVVNEDGGRDVAMSAGLTSNIAYMVAMHGYRGELSEAFASLVAKERQAAEAVIGDNVLIEASSRIENVRIGDGATIRGVSSLNNGTILSRPICPTVIEDGVVMRNFVVAEGAFVHGLAHLTNVFIGECVEVGSGFTAEELLAFANCQLLCGEAVAVLAGPFTVSHHKSTLLIAAAYSFYNAGSATNASNHHYRLGPQHQAVYERGVKTGSGSYVLEPAHVGAFTMVVGHHKTNPDTTMFPFSILAERDGESHLLVSQNLKTIGVFRDSRKWALRDRRKPEISRDRYSTGALNPLTISAMLKAIDFIDEKLGSSSSEMFVLSGVRIKRGLLSRARATYEEACRLYASYEYIKAGGVTSEDVDVSTAWCDLGGLIVPTEEVFRIEDALIGGEYESVSDLSGAIGMLADRAAGLASSWAVRLYEQRYKSSEGEGGVQADYASLRDSFAEAMVADGRREWAEKLAVGYGLDGSPDDAWADYVRIKGDADESSALRDCKDLEMF